ncbi:protein FAM47E-like [Sinocyclocheilus grahami]|uniref:protein FAM47E-like n=1 Tax=Sinocyclocheilus grahami TaxID=75366 RepID=UPI0007ACF9E2|nr:PREDICTED: protein FAM47E-like [Sinocyclocheilus grahami]
MSFKNGQVENIKFPWFKERLKTKYLRDLRQKQQLSGSLDSRKWRFLSPGLDDFRDGYPTVHKELFTQCKSGPSPAVFGMPNHACSVKFPQKRLSKNQVCYSKQNPQSQAQREFIGAVEYKLKQHPLALYPHLESGMTPELFDQVLSVLDPDMCMKAELSITSPMEHLEESSAQCEISTPETIKPSITIKPQKEKCKEATPRNPYKWQKLKETLGVEDQTASVKHLHPVSQEDDKQMITKLFCEWITSLGGETSDLTESTILDLFKSDYEKKPSLTLPINKTHPNQTPAKLSSSVEGHHKDAKGLNQANKPNRPQAANDPLRAPADITGSLDFEEQLSEKDEELKQIHGIQAFREFIINKGVRMPRFLSTIFSEDEQKNRIRGSNTTGSTSSLSKGRAVH